MPTREALEDLRNAEERMKVAAAEHMAYIERPGRGYSPEERAENKRLLDSLERTMAEYWQAFERAVKS